MRYICLALLALLAARLHGAELKPYTGAGCASVDEYFANEVWAKVAAEHPHYVTDVHATILHLLGRKRLERDFGNVIREVIT